MTSYFGKYRGKVETNLDPLKQGRIEVSCPAVLGDRKSWALPCVPYAGPGVGLYLLPPEKANIWVEFEGGDSNIPIWSGCFWGSGEAVPADPAIEQTKMLKTDSISLTLSDLSGKGGVTLQVGSPAVSTALKLVLDSDGVKIEASPSSVKVAQGGIELANGSSTVKLTSSSVSVNGGALEVT